MSFHPEVLEARQLQVLEATGPPLTARGFRLGGGTGLALLLGHRMSEDFDWFSTEPIADPLLLARELQDEGVALHVQQVARGTIHGAVDGVRLSLLEFGYPLLAEPIPWPDHDVAVLSLDDIACMKLSAIAQRGSRKDFVDLLALVQEHRPLGELLELYRRKFDVQEIGHLLYSLVYFEDAEAERMPKMLWDVEWRAVRKRIEGWVRELSAS
ncbi:MAG TPA: nucleotidyl transferase AbiEii/AbiGii toxin family protein [Thermoanaerobaculia bacterium]|nr:nucleotidyl transferase AbiEii/AbiGii toxin family protein [Thermoanaerobaculia bacterium]